MAQRKRKPKTSKGLHGARRHRLDEVSKVLLGKGMYRSFIPAGEGQKKKS